MIYLFEFFRIYLLGFFRFICYNFLLVPINNIRFLFNFIILCSRVISIWYQSIEVAKLTRPGGLARSARN